MKAVQEGTAGRRELSELKAVRLGLTQEFESYPAELQREVRPAYNRVIAALGRVIVQLQKKIEQGEAEGEEGQLEGQCEGKAVERAVRPAQLSGGRVQQRMKMNGRLGHSVAACALTLTTAS